VPHATAPAVTRPPRWLQLYDALLLLGAVTLPYSFLDLPLTGGGTRPLIAMLWFPVFAGILARFVVRLGGNPVELSFLGLIVLGFAWFPYVLSIDGDLSEYVVRIAALTAGVSIAIVASNFAHPRAVHTVVRALILGFSLVLVYAVLIQVPGAIGITSFAVLDDAIRGVLLFRSSGVPPTGAGRVSLMASEPSFAAFDLAGLLLIVLMFPGALPRRRLRHALLAVGVLLLLLAKSVTAFGLLAMVITAWMVRRGLRPGLIAAAVSVMAIGVAAFAALERVPVGYSPAARLQQIQSDPSALARFVLIRGAWIAGWRSDGFGIGPGQYSARWREFVEVDEQQLAQLPGALARRLDPNAEPTKVKPWSIYGMLFGEFGTLGLLGLLLGLGCLAVRILGTGRPDKWFLLSVLATICVAFATAYPPSMPIFWLVLGLLFAKLKIESTKVERLAVTMPPEMPGPAVASGVPDR